MKHISTITTTLCMLFMLLVICALGAPEAKAAVWGDYEYTANNQKPALGDAGFFIIALFTYKMLFKMFLKQRMRRGVYEAYSI